MKKKYIFPVVVIGGITAYYFLVMKKQPSQIDAGDYVDPTTTEPGTTVISTNPTGYNTQIPVYTTPTTAAIIAAQTATGKQYYYSLISAFTDPAYRAAFAAMTDNELYYSWWYYGNYLAHGIPLLYATRLLSNGQWDNSNPGNPELYNAIQAIHTKYGIF